MRKKRRKKVERKTKHESMKLPWHPQEGITEDQTEDC